MGSWSIDPKLVVVVTEVAPASAMRAAGWRYALVMHDGIIFFHQETRVRELIHREQLYEVRSIVELRNMMRN